MENLEKKDFDKTIDNDLFFNNFYTNVEKINLKYNPNLTKIFNNVIKLLTGIKTNEVRFHNAPNWDIDYIYRNIKNFRKEAQSLIGDVATGEDSQIENRNWLKRILDAKDIDSIINTIGSIFEPNLYWDLYEFLKKNHINLLEILPFDLITNYYILFFIMFKKLAFINYTDKQIIEIIDKTLMDDGNYSLNYFKYLGYKVVDHDDPKLKIVNNTFFIGDQRKIDTNLEKTENLLKYVFI